MSEGVMSTSMGDVQCARNRYKGDVSEKDEPRSTLAEQLRQRYHGDKLQALERDWWAR